MRARARFRSNAMQRAIHGDVNRRALRHIRAVAWLEARHERRRMQRLVVTSILVDRLELLNGATSISVNGSKVWPRDDFDT